MCSNEVERQAAIVGPKPKAPGEAPLTIMPKGTADGTAPDWIDDGDRGSG